jgi:uncharacterized RmlC-like cupin family protein
MSTTVTQPDTLLRGSENRDGTKGIVVVRGGVPIEAKQQIPYFVGVSERTSGAKSLSMQLVVLPPSGGCIPHVHLESESAIYLIQGHVETHYGPDLAEVVVMGPGDFIFIAPGVPHHAKNMSATEPAIAVAARNDANEQERVALYDVATHTSRL